MLLNDSQQIRLEKVNKYLTRNPDDVASLQMRGDLLRVGEDYKGSLKDFDLADKLKPSDPETLKARAATKRRLEDFAGALEDLNRSDSIDRNDHFTLKVRGAVKNSMEDFAGALEDLNRANRLKKDDIFTLTQLGCCKRNMNNLLESLTDLNASLQIYPLYIECISERVQTKIAMTHYRDAVSDMDRIVDLTSEEPEQLRRRAAIKDMMGDSEGYKKDIKRADIVEKRLDSLK